jgi:hypothetical protein
MKIIKDYNMNIEKTKAALLPLQDLKGLDVPL